MKKQLLPLSLLFVAGLYQAQTTQSENYIYSKVCLDADCVKKSETVQYFDGLGRPKQVVNVKASPTGKDIVTPIEYDQFGRQVKDYLPVPQSGSQNGGMYTNPLSNATAVYGDEKIYAEKVLESSPLDRIQQQIQVGNDWENHPVQFDYDANANSEVKKYTTTTTWQNGATTSTLTLATTNNGYYGANQLYKNTVTDEDGNQSIEFKNGRGQVLLVRKKNGSQNVDTYYVYNEYDQLAFVIPPKAAVSTSVSTSVLNNFCYQYRYDGRNRLVEKKLPGKGWEYMVYDQQDRLIMTQDANLKAQGKWLFTKYDQFGRVAYTGIATAGNRNTIQNTLNSATDVLARNNTQRTTSVGFSKNGMSVYYDNNASRNYPNSITALLSVNYYDTYPTGSPSIPNQIFSQATLTADAQNQDKSTKSLPTASYIKNIEDDGWTKNYTYYDQRGRVIGNRSYNHLSGYTFTYHQLDFAGIVKRANTYHKRKNTNAEVSIKDFFDYDAQNRLTRHRHKVDDNSVEILSRNTYNEIGQLIRKKVGGTASTPLQEVDYTYNIQGWMTGINPSQIGNLGNRLFAYEIDYNTPSNTSLSSAKYNGNIAEVSWNINNKLKRYHYQYDGLNRLLNATYTEPNATNPINHYYDESLTYDLNGNIQTLKRNAKPYTGTTPELIDNLQYTYNGNQLTKLEDATNNYNGFEGNTGLYVGGPWGTPTTPIIPYDANGNMKSFVQKKIGSIAYNHLNLPNKINLNNGASLSGWSREIRYIYRADGTKIKKENKKQQTVFGGTNTTTTTTDYLDGFHYETTESTQTGGGNFPILTLSSAMESEAFTPMLSSTSTTTPASSTVLKFIPTAEGFYDFEKKAYIYQYKDHLGNARVTYNKNIQIVDTNNYYPFGMNHLRDDAPSNFGQGSYKNYKYNGKELQETGMYDYGARFYMADIGRWGVHDPLSEKTLDPYGYVHGNPIRFIDPTGMEGEDWYQNKDDPDDIFWRDGSGEIEGYRNLGDDVKIGDLHYAPDGYVYNDSPEGQGEVQGNGRVHDLGDVFLDPPSKTMERFYRERARSRLRESEARMFGGYAVGFSVGGHFMGSGYEISLAYNIGTRQMRIFGTQSLGTPLSNGISFSLFQMNAYGVNSDGTKFKDVFKGAVGAGEQGSLSYLFGGAISKSAESNSLKISEKGTVSRSFNVGLDYEVGVSRTSTRDLTPLFNKFFKQDWRFHHTPQIP